MWISVFWCEDLEFGVFWCWKIWRASHPSGFLLVLVFFYKYRRPKTWVAPEVATYMIHTTPMTTTTTITQPPLLSYQEAQGEAKPTPLLLNWMREKKYISSRNPFSVKSFWSEGERTKEWSALAGDRNLIQLVHSAHLQSSYKYHTACKKYCSLSG